MKLSEEREKIAFIGPSGMVYWYEFSEYNSERKETFAKRWFRLAEKYPFSEKLTTLDEIYEWFPKGLREMGKHDFVRK